MGHVPTTAHTSGPMALTSDTTGPIPARVQVRPPSAVTHSGTVPDDEGGPPHRYPWVVVGELELGGEAHREVGIGDAPRVTAVDGHRQQGLRAVHDQREAVHVPDEHHRGQVRGGHGRPRGEQSVWESNAAKVCDGVGPETTTPMTTPSASAPTITTPSADVARRRRSGPHGPAPRPESGRSLPAATGHPDARTSSPPRTPLSSR